MTKKTIIISGIVGAITVSTVIFFALTAQGKEIAGKISEAISGKMTREKADKILGGSIKSYDDDFVIAWAKAKKNKKEYFNLEMKKYSTSTGKVVM